MYSKKIMQRFLKPKYAGKIANPDGVGTAGNPQCLLPEEKIHTNPSMIKISELNNGKVLNHEGEYSEVLNSFNREYNGKIIRLKNKLGTVSITPEHLIYAVKLPKHEKYFRTKNKKKLIPSWYHADDLEKGDIALYPITQKEEDLDFIDLDVPKLKYDFKSYSLPEKIPINGDFLRLSGYFLAEGCIRERKCNNSIMFSFNINEKEYIDDVVSISKKLFGIVPIIRNIKERKTTIIVINSARLARFFKRLFNKGAVNKSVPSFMLYLPILKQRDLIKGLWRGDGCINLNRDGPRAGYSTISPYLTQQLKILLLRQKIVPSIYEENEKIVRGVKHRKSYRIHVGQRDSLSRICSILGIEYNPKSFASVDSWFDNSHLYTPITGIEKKDYSGKVHNLEVENTHSFVSEAFTLHNCGDVMEVYLKVKNGIIQKIRFNTFGCGMAIAASDALCEMAEGKTLEEAEKITSQDIVKHLGGEVPAIKIHCSVLGMETLRKAIKNYKEKKK